jgi:circadian clock protein KaiA
LSDPLYVGTFCISDSLTANLIQVLNSKHYAAKHFQAVEMFSDFVVQERSHLDCLILEDAPEISQLYSSLHAHQVKLPMIIVAAKPVSSERVPIAPVQFHGAELRITVDQLEQLNHRIDQAINQFIRVAADLDSSGIGQTDLQRQTGASGDAHITPQQRLSQKLQERLGYLGVYYKRNPENFLRYMPRAQRQEFLTQLKIEYRRIVLNYFSEGKNLNQMIDNFVNLAFFADIALSKIVELHIELMDEFANQLKLEGRSEEILLDYRLTLIDVMAHLGEMYRRSIPRES